MRTLSIVGVLSLAIGAAHADPAAPPLTVPELAPTDAASELRLDAVTSIARGPGAGAPLGALVVSYRHVIDRWVVTGELGGQRALDDGEPGMSFTNPVLGIHRWFGRRGGGTVVRALFMSGAGSRDDRSTGPQHELVAAMPWARPGVSVTKLALGHRVARGRWAAQVEVGGDLSFYASEHGFGWLSGLYWLGAGAGVQVHPRLAIGAHALAHYFPRDGERLDAGTAVGATASVRVGPGQITVRADRRVSPCDTEPEVAYKPEVDQPGTCGLVSVGYALPLP